MRLRPPRHTVSTNRTLILFLSTTRFPNETGFILQNVSNKTRRIVHIADADESFLIGIKHSVDLISNGKAVRAFCGRYVRN